ncbi:MAG TPA: hypothetical protein PLL88_01005 [Anaerolineaceae bacterium]|nr:hypothetical protein [Anaerolineaceae bacterium]
MIADEPGRSAGMKAHQSNPGKVFAEMPPEKERSFASAFLRHTGE